MLKISVFYLDKQTSFFPKKKVWSVPWLVLSSANRCRIVSQLSLYKWLCFCLPLCKGKLSVANRLWRKFLCTAKRWDLPVFRPVDTLQYKPDKKLVDLTTVHWNEHFWHNRVFSSLHLTETTFFVEKHEFSENLTFWAGHHMVSRKTTNEFLVCYLLELQYQKLVHVLLYDIFVRYFWIKILFIF